MSLDPKIILEATGYIGLFIIVFVESGLLLGFFLPGDSLLFTAGFLASQNILEIGLVLPITFVGAVLGDSAGYSLGRRFGPKVFRRENSLLFDKEHLRRSQEFYAKHGGKAIVLARFLAVVRTFAPILAGVGKMPYTTFLSFNVIGGLLWSISLPLLGFFLGRSVPDIDKYLLPLILVVILTSFLPSMIHLMRHPKERQRIFDYFKRHAKRWFSRGKRNY